MESKPSPLKVSQLLPYWLQADSLRFLTLTYASIDKKKTQPLIKYLATAHPLEALPLSPEDSLLISNENPELIKDPEDHRYGRYRVPEKKVTTIDMTHVKRIRGCPTDGARVDVVITMKSKWEEVKAEETKKL
jgi:hypothetical protein